MKRVKRAEIDRLLKASGHIVEFRQHNCRFGNTFRVECLDCDYRGPLVSWHRAKDIGNEHRLKVVGAWEPAR